MEISIVYEDDNILAINKPAGLTVFSEEKTEEKTLADILLEKFPYLNKNEPPRYGIAHRLDKDTSGVLLVAKSKESLIFLQKQFKNRTIQKKYIALVVGNIKEDTGKIETLIGRSPKDRLKQKAFFVGEPGSQGKREAITEFKVQERFKDYTLLEVTPKTGRKHQIRCHLSYLSHPIAGDKLYGFRRQPSPKGLTRHFLHAYSLRFETQDGQTKEIKAELPEELANIIKELKKQNYE